MNRRALIRKAVRPMGGPPFVYGVDQKYAG